MLPSDVLRSVPRMHSKHESTTKASLNAAWIALLCTHDYYRCPSWQQVPHCFCLSVHSIRTSHEYVVVCSVSGKSDKKIIESPSKYAILSIFWGSSDGIRTPKLYFPLNDMRTSVWKWQFYRYKYNHSKCHS